MIIFTPIKQIPQEYLELKGINRVIQLNLTSYHSDVPTLNLLIPSSDYISEDLLNGDCATPDFDVAYHSFIINNDAAFLQLMSIIIPVFTDPDTLVQILINVSNFRDVITESLCKLIQQRYGYNSYIVYELEDFLYTEESDMTIPGLFSIDSDIQRWYSLCPEMVSDNNRLMEQF